MKPIWLEVGAVYRSDIRRWNVKMLKESRPKIGDSPNISFNYVINVLILPIRGDENFTERFIEKICSMQVYATRHDIWWFMFVSFVK
jgi:hypothetical protein